VRILVTAGPSFGHVNPVLPVALAARRAGHDVVVATGAELVAHVREFGLPVWQVGPSRAENDAAFRAAHPNVDALSPSRRMQTAITALFTEPAAPRAADLLDRTRTWRPDVVVHELSEPAGAVVAARTGARHVVQGLGLPVSRPLWDATFGPGFARLCASFDVPELTERLFDATYLDIWPASLRPVAPAWADARPLRPVGGQAAAAAEWDAGRLDALPHERTVHLTLGTIFSDAPGVLDTALTALRELPVNLVVTVGPQGDPTRFGPQPPHVLVERYVPHDLLLPRCALLVGHGGAGITLAGLAHGLPQLVLPQGLDQFVNADLCVRAGAALVVRPDELSRGTVGDAAEQLLDDPGFGDVARRVSVEIAAMPAADEVLAGVCATSPADRPFARTDDG
jgi:UDP:flavonoid glycosyltransferase YjiC (YdhE family)